MINDNIFNIFSFFTFSFGYLRNHVFWPNSKKMALKTRSRKFPKVCDVITMMMIRTVKAVGFCTFSMH